MHRFPNKYVASTKIVETLSDFFSPDFLNELARETKFVQRKSSKITGEMFLKLQLFGSLDTAPSLREQLSFLKEHYDINLSKQSLDERYNTYAVAFTKSCFNNMLLKLLKLPPVCLNILQSKFESIYIEDSTAFQLPKELAHFYAGAGGDTQASIKINYAYDLLSGQSKHLDITDGKCNDARFLDKPEAPIQANSLYLRDLGYYKVDEFSKIIDAKGHFVSRYKSGTNIYTKIINKDDNTEKYLLVDLKKILKSVSTQKNMPIFLGEQKIPVQLFIEKVPNQVAQEKRRKLKAKVAKNKNWTLSEERKLLCDFNLFIANRNIELTLEQITMIYALRWQIELIFKVWKSIFNINQQLNHKNIFRFECYLYATLIKILLSQDIMNIFKMPLLKRDFELSELKTQSIIKESFRSFFLPKKEKN